ncbi:hypothetical protein [Yoonia sp.]|uniref:hypothetical protein n=1 Tax=Yoonia sp. TaxID=2212373 RepID=UPI00397496C2
MIDERDQYLAEKIKNSPGKKTETARHPAQTMRGLSKTMCVALAVATAPSISLMSSAEA